MSSTYSTNLKIELIGTGEQTGSWGTTTNTNLGTTLEEAIVGKGDVSFTNDANLTLTLSSSNTSQTARKYYLSVTSTVSLTAQRDLIVPTSEKTYAVYNGTTGSQAIRVKTSAGTGIVVPNGKRMVLYVDGTNVVEQIDYATNLEINALTIATALPVASGGTGATTAANARTNLGLGTIATQAANNVAITGGAISGITDLAVADGGTGASTASDARTNLGLGTIATQAANNVSITGGTMSGVTSFASNNVSITGGSISGITDLAIADGGTGASDATNARANLGAAASGANSDITSLAGLTTALSVAQGGTGVTTKTGTGPVVLSVSPYLTGEPHAPTATAGTNTTQIATTAFVQSEKPSAATQAEMEAGTETAIRRMSPLNVAQAIAAKAPGGIRGQVFTSSGTFTVPAGVTAVKVRGCGGGGGAWTLYGSGDGGTTSFGSYCSATGGIATSGLGGTATGGDLNITGGSGGYVASGTSATGGAVGGANGGYTTASSTVLPRPSGLLGRYGCGASGTAGGGGAGGYFERYITGLTPGASITVTIGAEGTGAGAGICIVEW